MFRNSVAGVTQSLSLVMETYLSVMMVREQIREARIVELASQQAARVEQPQALGSHGVPQHAREP